MIYGKAAKCHMLFSRIREVKVSSDWFKRVLVIFCRFLNVQLFAISASYTENDIGRGARKVISDLNGSLGSRRFLYVMNEGTSFA